MSNIASDYPDSFEASEERQGEPVVEKPSEPVTEPSETPAEEPAPEPVAEEPSGESHDISALKRTVKATREERDAEKRRAREYEEKVREFERKNAELEAQLKARDEGPKPEEPEIDFLDDPEGWAASREKKLREAAKAEAMGAIRAALYEERLAESLVEMRAKHPDYDEVERAFAEAAKTQPWLVQEVQNARKPAEVAYRRGKQILSGDTSDPDEITKLREENERLKAQLSTKPNPPPPPIIPESNAGARGGGAGKLTGWDGPPSFDQGYPDSFVQ